MMTACTNWVNTTPFFLCGGTRTRQAGKVLAQQSLWHDGDD